MDGRYQSDSLELQRERMVRTQLANRGIYDARVLQAIREVPRHEFVPKTLWADAYEDHPLPIGEGQTISQPYIVAIMLQHLALQSTDRALEVGSGSGYATALLSRLCREVYSIERYASLAEAAESTLRALNCSNVKVAVGDGSRGWAEYAPYDAILVSAAASDMPTSLFEQLKEKGSMVVPVGSMSSQQLQLIRKVDGQALVTNLEGCRFVPLVANPPESE
jgi:protein-L-isoaspartate(D-aspartate) O-methyltransferase